jgi:hypothetical protein
MFVDEAIEGSREDRDQFQLMLSLARQGPRQGGRYVTKGCQSLLTISDAAQPQRTTEPARVRLARGRRNVEQVASAGWTQDVDACITCGTTERPDRAHGRCKRCDNKWRYRNRSNVCE